MTFEVKGDKAIIPNVLFENNVENHAVNKFGKGYKDTCHNGFIKQAGAFEKRTYFTERCKAYPAKCQHTPMSVSAPKKFNKTVPKCTESKKYSKALKPFQKNHQLYYER